MLDQLSISGLSVGCNSFHLLHTMLFHNLGNDLGSAFNVKQESQNTILCGQFLSFIELMCVIRQEGKTKHLAG